MTLRPMLAIPHRRYIAFLVLRDRSPEQINDRLAQFGFEKLDLTVLDKLREFLLPDGTPSRAVIDANGVGELFDESPAATGAYAIVSSPGAREIVESMIIAGRSFAACEHFKNLTKEAVALFEQVFFDVNMLRVDQQWAMLRAGGLGPASPQWAAASFPRGESAVFAALHAARRKTHALTAEELAELLNQAQLVSILKGIQLTDREGVAGVREARTQFETAAAIARLRKATKPNLTPAERLAQYVALEPKRLATQDSKGDVAQVPGVETQAAQSPKPAAPEGGAQPANTPSSTEKGAPSPSLRKTEPPAPTNTPVSRAGARRR